MEAYLGRRRTYARDAAMGVAVFQAAHEASLPIADHDTTLCGVPATNPSMFFFSVSMVPLIVFALYQAM